MNTSRTQVGIVGGGQLGRMMTKEAQGLGVHISVLDPTPMCPAAEYADAHVVGDFTDKDTVLAFARGKDVLTFEIESANAEALIELEQAGVAIHPSPHTLSVIRDKFVQKEFLEQHDIPVAPYAAVDTAADVERFAAVHGYPLVLKSRTGAYDGRGNRTIADVGGIAEAMEALGGTLYIEAWVPFTKELAVVAVRGQDGTIHTYPVVETIHTDHICDTVIAPAPVSLAVAERAAALARRILEVFHGAGVFGIEMFLTETDEVLINEIAPRVHNSGHFSLGACNVSQFEEHMRAVCGLPLVEPRLQHPVAVMKNILGTRNAPAEPRGIEEAEALGAHVEIYGKRDTKEKRKMGHLTVTADSVEEGLARATRAHALISI